MVKLEKNEYPIKSVINSFPKVLSYVSIPLRKDSKGFSDEGRRYTINAGGVDLELIAGSKIFPIPTGKLGRIAFAYIASNVIRLNLSKFTTSKEQALRQIENIRFSLPSLSEMTKEMLNLDRAPSNRERNQVYEQICGVLNLGIVFTPVPELNYYDFPNTRFFLVKQFNITKACNHDNYVVFSKEGLMFFYSYVIPIVYKDYIELNPIEQDLYVYLKRKTFFPQALLQGNTTVNNLRKVIKVSNIVKQIFNCNSTDKHYKDNEEKLHEAYRNLIQKYPDLFYGAMWNNDNHTLTILPNHRDPFNIDGQKQILRNNRTKANLINQIQKYKKQEPYIKAYHEKKMALEEIKE